MKESHIKYMQELCASITLGADKPFSRERFYKIESAPDNWQQQIPFVICRHEEVRIKRVGRRTQRLPKKELQLRFVRQLYSQLHRYRLEFWLTDSTNDILSNSTTPGIVDQALAYLQGKRVTSDETGASIRVEPGIASRIKDTEHNTEQYYTFLELMFYDGLHQTEAVDTLSGTQFEIRNKEVV